MAREIKHYDDSVKGEKKYLVPPYAKVIVTVQRIQGDELHPAKEGEPANQHIANREGEYVDLVVVNKILVLLGLDPVEDPTEPKRKPLKK